MKPDVQEFEYKGYRCVISHPYQCALYCGYVCIPRGHKLHGMFLDDIFEEYPAVYDVAHGGISYSGRDILGDYAIGFDTGNLFDNEHTQNVGFMTENLKAIVDEVEKVK